MYSNYTTNPYAWSAVQLKNLSESYVPSLLIFQIFDPEADLEKIKITFQDFFTLVSSVGNLPKRDVFLKFSSVFWFQQVQLS